MCLEAELRAVESGRQVKSAVRLPVEARTIAVCIFALIAGPALSAVAKPSEGTALSAVVALWERLEDDRGEPLGAVNGMAEARDGRIWVSFSRHEFAILGFSSDGSVAEGIVPQGATPGGLLIPNRITRFSAASMAVYDLSRSSIEVFDLDGQWERRILLDRQFYNTKGFVVLPDGRMVLSAGSLARDFSVHVFSKLGNRLEGLVPVPVAGMDSRLGEEVEIHTAGGALAVWRDGVLYSNSAPHRLLYLPLDRADEAQVVAEREDLLKPGVEVFASPSDSPNTQAFDWFYPQTRGVFLLGDGRILNIVTFQAGGRTLWELYEPSGELVRDVVVERAYWPWALTRDGDVLASEIKKIGESFIHSSISRLSIEQLIR